MAEQIILNTDLYDNLLTERKGDYTAKPRITGTLYNTDIAARIVAARTEYQHGTILNILDMADSHKVQAIAEGPARQAFKRQIDDERSKDIAQKTENIFTVPFLSHSAERKGTLHFHHPRSHNSALTV